MAHSTSIVIAVANALALALHENVMFTLLFTLFSSYINDVHILSLDCDKNSRF